jgi:hypothetical protein
MKGPRKLSLSECQENFERAALRWAEHDAASTLESRGGELRACMIAGEVMEAARRALKAEREQAEETPRRRPHEARGSAASNACFGA